MNGRIGIYFRLLSVGRGLPRSKMESLPMAEASPGAKWSLCPWQKLHLARNGASARGRSFTREEIDSLSADTNLPQ